MISDFVLIMIVKGSTWLRPRSAGSPKTRCRFAGPNTFDVMQQLAERDGLMQNGDW
jgi:hypothetical protein